METKIHIPAPKWNSNLVSVIVDLEKIRTKRLISAVPAYIFFQLKEIFQILEKVGSARIEGNNTTLSEYIETVIDKDAVVDEDEKRRELENLDRGIEFIERNTDADTKIDRAYLSELHRIVVDGLSPPPKGEGSRHSGELRKENVRIQKSSHVPPSVAVLQETFDNFLEFINGSYAEQNQLLMVAIAHHRFMYMHPYDNGNGRLGRLLNYALLIKFGFNVKAGRIIDPSSVFYSDSEKYYDMLNRADSLQDSHILDWAEYFLFGLKNQIEKVDSLLQLEYTRDKILLPTLSFALDRAHITKQEYDILTYLVRKQDMAIKSAELSRFGLKTSAEKSYAVRKLREKKMLDAIEENGRVYTIKFVNNYLLRGTIKTLTENGFVDDFLNRNTAP